MPTTITLDADVAEFFKEQSRLLNKSVEQAANEALRRHVPSDKRETGKRTRFQVKPFSLGFAPEFEGMTPKEILNKLDDEYYEKKLAGGADEYRAKKPGDGSNPT